MARYLVVAHQTAESAELRQAIADLAAADPQAEFVLLVPATPPANLLVWEEGEAQQIAAKRATSVGAELKTAGFRIAAAKVGDTNPLDAIRDELRGHRGQQRYAAIIVSTLPKGVSSWLRMDLVSRLRRVAPRYRVIHVESGVDARV